MIETDIQMTILSVFSNFLFVSFYVWNFRNKKEANELPFGLTPIKIKNLDTCVILAQEM